MHSKSPEATPARCTAHDAQAQRRALTTYFCNTVQERITKIGLEDIALASLPDTIFGKAYRARVERSRLHYAVSN